MSKTTVHQVVAALIEADWPAFCDDKGQIVGHAQITTDWAVIAQCETPLTQEQIDRASLALRGITQQARAWNFGNVGRKLDRAYHALGAPNPYADQHTLGGHEFHVGAHVAQMY